jgi:hypothetical protein
MTMGEPSEDLQYFSKLQKQQRRKKRMGLFKEKIKHLDPLYFQISYLSLFFFVLNNLKSYEIAI